MLQRKIIIPRYIFILVVIAIFLSVITFFSFQSIEVQEPKAKVLTPFGCAETTLTVSEFQAEQRFSDQVLGGHFIRCK